ncbi:MAG: hypothetical protein LBP72_02915, partial [Dysgonamonadaceae bacterium]|jgi:hypothetical protein|nr:hypothetical protein [Dysgonamonadaceae bacterium]
MTNTTPNLIKEEEFNREVKEWSIRTRNKIRRNAPIGTDSLSDEEKLIFTQSSVRKKYGTTNKVQFSFARHGVFVHYGVGRGYIREGNQVKRGRKLNMSERLNALKSGKTEKEIQKMKHTYAAGTIKRTPVDWFDVEIKTGIAQLADIAQNFYGDKVLDNMLIQMDKALIEKK